MKLAHEATNKAYEALSKNDPGSCQKHIQQLDDPLLKESIEKRSQSLEEFIEKLKMIR